MQPLVALLGRKDEPTDGVDDYCSLLGRALEQRGIELRKVRVPWIEKGWQAALRQLWRESSGWHDGWVLIQYTAIGWSRRGFPFGVLGALAILRRRGVRCVVVFHEADHQGKDLRSIGRIRGACQDWVIRRLYRGATKAVFTIPLEAVSWLPQGPRKAAFIPIGSNIPECPDRRQAPGAPDREKTVIVFGITEVPSAAREVEEIVAVMREAGKAIPKLRLVAVGRGSMEVQQQLARALEACDVQVVVRGVLPAEEVAREFKHADVLLFVRGAITPQRGSAIAGVACGLPIVGYRDGKTWGPLDQAGVEWSPWRDRDSLVRGLVRVLSDPRRWTELHERNLRVQRQCLSWETIAAEFCRLLDNSGASL